MFESVNRRNDAQRTHAREPARPVYYKLTSEPSAQVSYKKTGYWLAFTCFISEIEDFDLR